MSIKLDIKSIVTISMILTLEIVTIGSLIYAFITNSTELFTVTFGLFGTEVGAVVTYFFTRKNIDSEHTNINIESEEGK